MGEEGVGILEPYEVQFSDLMLLSSDEVSSSSREIQEIERLQAISRSVMQNLGPTGPGLLTISGVPNAPRLRRTLLPLARRLALLNAEDRKRVLKEHNLGSDVPLKNLDRSVSSFAMQLKYVQGVESTTRVASHGGNDNGEHCPATEDLRGLQDSEFKNLGNSFKELGFLMMELGLRLAQTCDRAMGGQELEQSLLDSCMAKGRLIHYHSTLDNLIVKEVAERQKSNKQNACPPSMRNKEHHTNGDEATSNGNGSNLWQQWHYDYGIFTVLTGPLFILPCCKQRTRANGCSCTCCEQEYLFPSGHTYLKIFNPNKNCLQMVKASPESFIVQVGESADVLSKGKLRANLHSVCRPAKVEELSRETFVVFLQPAWSKTFSLSDYPFEILQSNGLRSAVCREKICSGEHEHGKLGQELHKIVPPLFSRLKDGMTFAEFSQETTKQYYGGNGLQAKR